MGIQIRESTILKDGDGGGVTYSRRGPYELQKKIEKIAYSFLVVNIKNQMNFFIISYIIASLLFLFFCFCFFLNVVTKKCMISIITMRGSRGGVVRPPPPRNLQSLISPISLEMKKILIFHIYALPQLYVRQNQSTK